MWNPFDFSGKKIVVAGATSGMGKATAIKLSQQGAQVLLVGRDSDRLKELMGSLSGFGHRFFVKDFDQSGDVQNIFDDIVSDGRKIDGFVYVAGVANTIPLNALSYKNMENTMKINLYAFVDFLRFFSKTKYHNNASVVAVSSIAAKYPGKCQNIYSASKGALNLMVQTLAIELADKGIRVNTVMPACTNTKMLLDAKENRGEEQVEKDLQKQILGLEEPEDIADVVLFLLSDASRKITGRAMYADAGYLNL